MLHYLSKSPSSLYRRTFELSLSGLPTTTIIGQPRGSNKHKIRGRRGCRVLCPISGIHSQNGLSLGKTTPDFGSTRFFPFSSDLSQSSARCGLSLCLNVQPADKLTDGGIGTPLKRRNWRLSTLGPLWSTTGSGIVTSLVDISVPRLAYIPVTVRGTRVVRTGCVG
jgi:hypothetical protein